MIPTVRKERWNNKSRPGIVKGEPINPNMAVESRYYMNLVRLINRMTIEVEGEIRALFETEHAKEYFAQDMSIAAQARILTNALTRKFEDLFATNAPDIADEFAQQSDKASNVAVQSSIQKLSGGLSLPTTSLNGKLKDILSATVTENVALIKSIPAQYLANVQGAVMRSITTGNGLQDLIPFLHNHKGITLRRARMIANDQTRKAMNGLSKGRMQQIGLEKYEWLHTGGSNHPRKEHIAMSGNIYRFDDPPVIDEKTGERGIPGQAVNCFIGSTKISLANGCRNLWRYFYTGNVVNIVVHGDEIITCTPNHPILTLRGWLSANKIQEGDYLISSQSDDVTAVDVNRTKFNPTFDDFFASLAERQGFKSILGSEFNFHGDIPEKNVDRITVDHILPDWAESPNSEQIEKLILTLPNIIGDDSVLSFLTKIIQSGGASGFREINTLLNGKFRHPNLVGMMTISQDDAALLQNLANNLTANIISFAEIEYALSIIIQFANNERVSICGIENSNPWSDIIKSASKFFSNSSLAASMERTEFTQAHSVFKRLFRVEKKFVSVFSDHVYTMQSFNGWYTVASADIISKNCRCRMAPVIEF